MNIKYTSTRAAFNFDSADAIKQGISQEGGLFVPKTIPQFSYDEISAMSDMTYNQRAYAVLSKFLTDFTADELKKCIDNAYDSSKFSGEKTVPLVKINDSAYMLELWHGPTCAFKDMALQILPHFLTASLKKTDENRTAVILVATSGDTGKAALEGFRDVDMTKIIVFYPELGVSNMQKKQMQTQKGDNVDVCGIKGNFDDAQSGVKEIFTNDYIKNRLNENGYFFSSANSINWGRLVPQIVYYFSSYADLLQNGEIKIGDKINICVPTGNFGNILAAYYAKCAGLPVNKFICASNKNKVLTDFINTGIYNKNREFFATSSPSMDILISSNLERLLYHLSGNNTETITELMNSLKNNGEYKVSDEIKEKLQSEFSGGFCDEEDTAKCIKDIFDKYGYIMDTHTAVGMKVYLDYVKKTSDTTKTVIASTANCYKFSDNVLRAVAGKNENYADDFEILEKLEQVTGTKAPCQISGLRDAAVRFDRVIDKSGLSEELERFLNLK